MIRTIMVVFFTTLLQSGISPFVYGYPIAKVGAEVGAEVAIEIRSDNERRYRWLPCGSFLDQETGLEWLVLRDDIQRLDVEEALKKTPCPSLWYVPSRDTIEGVYDYLSVEKSIRNIWLQSEEGLVASHSYREIVSLVAFRQFRKVRSQRRFRSILNKGRTAVQKASYQEGLKFYFQALALDPTHPMLLNEIAYAYALNSESTSLNLEEAIVISKRATYYAWDQKLIRQTFYTQGLLLQKLNRLEESLQRYKLALALGGGVHAQKKIDELSLMISPNLELTHREVAFDAEKESFDSRSSADEAVNDKNRNISYKSQSHQLQKSRVNLEVSSRLKGGLGAYSKVDKKTRQEMIKTLSKDGLVTKNIEGFIAAERHHKSINNGDVLAVKGEPPQKKKSNKNEKIFLLLIGIFFERVLERILDGFMSKRHAALISFSIFASLLAAYLFWDKL